MNREDEIKVEKLQRRLLKMAREKVDNKLRMREEE